jgi:IMP cyclohydrolase
MYLGRIVSIGRTNDGKNVAMYRVSSRSFPNRQTVKMGDKVAVMPRPGFEGDLQKNPYITYNCVRIAGDYAVVSNGSQTDPIAEKIASGMPVRDAMTLGLLALDYEHDSLDTPRIVGAVEMNGTRGFLGIVRKDAVLVREFELKNGQALYISTYEKNRPCDDNLDAAFDVANAEAACDYVVSGGVFADFENPVAAACVVCDKGNFDIAVKTI